MGQVRSAIMLTGRHRQWDVILSGGEAGARDRTRVCRSDGVDGGPYERIEFGDPFGCIGAASRCTVPRRAIALLRMSSLLRFLLRTCAVVLAVQLQCPKIWLVAVTLVPAVAQVCPIWVGRFDQVDLFFSPPCFHFLFAADGGHDIAVTFEVDEVGHVVLCRKAFGCVSFVLEHAMLDVAGHADVEHTALAGEDVDVLDL